MSIGDLLENVIREKLGLKGDIEIRNAETRAVLYDPEFEDNIDSLLKSFGLSNGRKMAITCDADDQNGEGEYQIRLYMLIEEYAICFKFALSPLAMACKF